MSDNTHVSSGQPPSPPEPLLPSGPSRRGWDLLALLSLPALHLAFFWRAALLRGFLIHADLCFWFEPYASLLH